jgi:CheY-like chemotaxis protein
MVSVTEWADIETEAVAAGVSRFISKPLFPSVLVDNINECVDILHNDVSNERAKKIIENRDYHGCNVMIAEDVEINREIMESVLAETGIDIDFAENGQKAVLMFVEHPEKYDLIFMDIQMPEMDGFEATRQIRAINSAAAADIPIVAMTANVFKEDIDNCLAAGMNNHLGKPINTGDLFVVLVKYLR